MQMVMYSRKSSLITSTEATERGARVGDPAMARGMTEPAFHSAAGAIVDEGERPTGGRIRAHLCTGSRNTVTRWLETWWQGLGQGLQAQQASLSLPDAPDAVGKVAGELWRLALEHAQAKANEALEIGRAHV